MEFKYQVTDNGELIDSPYENNPEGVDGELLLKRVKWNDGTVEFELKKLIRKYPGLPIFQNHLATFYQNRGNMKKAGKITMEVFKKFPDYVFGRVNGASILFDKGKVEKVPEILGEALEIGARFPNRKVFHISEYEVFYFLVFRYYLKVKDMDKAEAIYARLEEMGIENRSVFQQMKDIWDKVSPVFNIQKQQTRFEKLRKLRDIRNKKYKFPSKLPAQRLPEGSYEIGLFSELAFDQIAPPWEQFIEVAERIPREKLVAGIKQALIDSMECYYYWMNNLVDQPMLATGALILAAYFELDELSDLYLQLFSMDDAFLADNFDDLSLESMWQALAVLYKDTPEKLFEFIKDPSRGEKAVMAVLEALVYIFRAEEQKSAPILKEFNGFVEFLLQNDRGKQFDPKIWTWLVMFFMDSGSEELVNKLEPLFKKEWFYTTDYETFASVKKEFYKFALDIKTKKFESWDTVYDKVMLVESYKDDFEDISEGTAAAWRELADNLKRIGKAQLAKERENR